MLSGPFPSLFPLSLLLFFKSLSLLTRYFPQPFQPLHPGLSKAAKSCEHLGCRAGGVCPCLCVHPRPSTPSLALPQISGLTSRPLIRLFPASLPRVANRLGALRARPPTPADSARRAGRGRAGAGAPRVPARPLLPAPGGGARGAGLGECRVSSPLPPPAPPSLSPGRGAGPWPRLAPGAPLCPSPFCNSHLSTPGHFQQRREGASSRRGGGEQGSAC